MERLLTILLLVALSASGCASSVVAPAESGSIPEVTTTVQSSTPDQLPEPSPQPVPTPESQAPALPSGEHPVIEEPPAGITYEYVTEKPVGWFKTGQEADILLGAFDFNESGGPLVLNHPGKVVIHGSKLIVSDTWNNRVLLWDEIPVANDEPPDLVLGQPDFNSNEAGLGSTGLNWPMGIGTDGEKLLVADTNNNRILVWNEFPTINGQPADLVLGVPDFDSCVSSFSSERDKNTFIDWPWDVWTDGERVISGGGPVLVWKTFPTENNQQPDIILGVEDFSMRFMDSEPGDPLSDYGSPRGIASDGKRLALSTYDPHRIYIYNEFPEKSGERADFFVELPNWGAMGLSLSNDMLFALAFNKLYIWNNFPVSSDQEADLIYGADRTRDQSLVNIGQMVYYSDHLSYSFGISSDNGMLAIADTHNNRVMIYNSIPTSPTTEADVILGKPELFFSRNSFGSGSTPFSDGKQLIVGVDGFGTWIYKKLPDESKAVADTVLGNFGNTIVGGHTITDGEHLIMVHREGSRVFIWNKIPDKDNELPDVILGKDTGVSNWNSAGSGRIAMNGPSKAATDGKSLFVTDQGNNRILIWNELPTENQTPADFVLGQSDFNTTDAGAEANRLAFPVGISTDGSRLAVADMENQRILVWDLPITRNGQEPDFVLREFCGPSPDEPIHLNLPQDVVLYNDSIFVADGGFHRVLVWSKFPETDSTPPDIVIGQKDFQSSRPSNERDCLFAPVSISFDGSFLWVGETKYSNRLLRFSVQPVD